MKITDLDWKPWGSHQERAISTMFADAEQAVVEFPNGYGASCLRGGRFYTDNGTYEIGVLNGGSLDYDNPVAGGDVLGYQTEEQANAALAAIEALPPKAQSAALDREESK